MKRYNPKEIEPKWQQVWQDTKLYEADLTSKKPKYIGFGMFNYPSGAGIHIGHGKNFTLPDVILRAKRQQGYETYSPVGFDSFGLPAENYAIRTGTPPRATTDAAIANYRKQYRAMGWGQDWSREIDTSQPEYYRWTQWIFSKLYEHKLAYQKESMQWWCPHDLTVLANEQVEGGKCWRCGHEVVKKNLKQWFFKITEYADEILGAIDDLDWTESVKTMQRNWIGKSQGAEVVFAIDGSSEALTVFTTRPDTLYGATFLVLAPEHPLLEQLATPEHKDAVLAYKNEAVKKSEVQRQENKQKTGEFTGAYAVNPINGEKVPIWTADYVLMGYGTGAIMAVPAHDERDYEFAKAFELPIVEVVAPEFGEKRKEEVWVDGSTTIVYDSKAKKFLALDWPAGWTGLVGGGLDEGESYEACAKRELSEEAGITNWQAFVPLGNPVFAHYYHPEKKINRIASTHAYLVIIDDQQGGQTHHEAHETFSNAWYSFDELIQKVSQRDGVDHWLEILGRAKKYLAAQEQGTEAELLNISHAEGVMINSGPYDGLSSSAAREKIVMDLEEKGAASEKTNFKMRDWLISRQRYWGAPIPIIHCPEHGAVSVPEADLPVVLPDVENFAPTGGATSVLATVEDWVNVPCPTCGKPAKRETDTMDGYACSSWYFLRYADPHNAERAWDPEIANKWMPVDFYNGGDHAVAHLLYARFFMRFFHKLGLVNTPEPFQKMYYHAKIMAPDGTAFSKTKGNGPDPLKLIEVGYGADSIRTYIMFISPPDVESPWSEEGVPGCYRFLQRVWNVTYEFLDATDTYGTTQSTEVLRLIHKAIKKVDADIQAIKFNTAIAALMECVNGLYKIKAESGFIAETDWRFALESLLQLVAPFAPHMSEELWHQMGHEDSIHIDHWPAYDDKYLVEDTVTIAVQVNGKLRGTVTAPAGSDEASTTELAKAEEKIAANLADKQIVKTIYVPGKLLSFVVK